MVDRLNRQHATFGKVLLCAAWLSRGAGYAEAKAHRPPVTRHQQHILDKASRRQAKAVKRPLTRKVPPACPACPEGLHTGTFTRLAGCYCSHRSPSSAGPCKPLEF